MSSYPSPDQDWGRLLRDLAADLPPTKPIPADLLVKILSEEDLTEDEAVRLYKRLVGGVLTSPG